MAGTGGLLPKVIASYNAGPAPIAEWNTRYDQSDPLLYIESIPYWETRGYVPIILRNYWIYEDARRRPLGQPAGARRRACGRASPACPARPRCASRRAPRQQTAMGARTRTSRYIVLALFLTERLTSRA